MSFLSIDFENLFVKCYIITTAKEVENVKAKRIIISVLYILFLAVFLISGYKLISYYTERKEATDLYREFINTAIKTPTPQNTEEEKESILSLAYQIVPLIPLIYDPVTNVLNKADMQIFKGFKTHDQAITKILVSELLRQNVLTCSATIDIE